MFYKSIKLGVERIGEILTIMTQEIEKVSAF